MPGVISSLEGAGTNTIEYAVGFGLGVALGEALRPLAVSLSQDAFSTDPSKALDAGDAAKIVAQAIQDNGWGTTEAEQTGLNSDRFSWLAQTQLTAPGTGQLLELLRRAQIGDDDFTHGLRKAQLETTWDAAIKSLVQQPLQPEEIAKAIHRGIMVADGLLIALPPTEPGDVPSVPPSTIDPITEASWSGIEQERLRIMVGNAGLPLGLMEMLQLMNRGFMKPQDVQRGIAESNLRNEYQDVALQLARRILTPHEYAELSLRGWITTDAMHAGAEMSGMTDADTDLLFKMQGRPIVPHQITKGLARGGSYEGPTGDIPDVYITAMRQSNVRPEWYQLDYLANQYTWPSYFVLKAITPSVLTVEQCTDILLWSGWEPTLAKATAESFASTAGTGVDPNVTKARSQLWTATHNSYVNSNTDEAEAKTRLTLIGVDDTAQTAILALWDSERSLVRTSLTAAQIVKAVGQPGKDAAWATERLQELGWSADDAATLLAE
jgi:hypothetical protein